jgi:hypothetical protein
MSQQQDLRTVTSRLSAEWTTQALQARLDAAGLKTDLSSVPAAKVPETFLDSMRPLLDTPVGALTVDQIRAITSEVEAKGSALATSPYQQFNYQVRETEHGLEATFRLKAGQCLRDVLNATISSYDQNARPKQKTNLEKLMCRGAIESSADFINTQLKEDATFTLTILRDAASKSRDEVMNTETGQIKIVNGMVATERAVMLVAAALHIDRSVAQGVLLTPFEPQGDLLEGKIVRTRTGAVYLSPEGLNACYVGDGNCFDDVVAAGSPFPGV